MYSIRYNLKQFQGLIVLAGILFFSIYLSLFLDDNVDSSDNNQSFEITKKDAEYKESKKEMILENEVIDKGNRILSEFSSVNSIQNSSYTKKQIMNTTNHDLNSDIIVTKTKEPNEKNKLTTNEQSQKETTSDFSLENCSITKGNEFRKICYLKYAELSGSKITATTKHILDLNGLSLREHNLIGADLSGVNLSNHDFSEMDLTGVNFKKSNLAGVNFQNAKLTKANLAGATLVGTNFNNANLVEAKIFTNFENASFRFANLSGADLSSSKISSSDFYGANLSGADLSYAEFKKINLTMSSLKESNLKNAKFISVGLYAVNFDKANLEGTTLTKIDFGKTKNETILKNELEERGAKIK